MARVASSEFELLLAILPATATIIGVVVLRQTPKPLEVIGITLVILGVAVPQERSLLS